MGHILHETPFEDLLLLLLRHDIAGCLWPWLAAVTAAISLLGICAAATRIFLTRPSHHDPGSTPAVLFQESFCCPRPAPAVKQLLVGQTEECVGSAKARFTVSYSYVASAAVVDDCCEFGEEEEEEQLGQLGDGTCRMINSGRFAQEKWEDEEWVWVDEGVIVRRKRDLGWYRCQEWTMINGSIVKFWDAASSSSPRS